MPAADESCIVGPSHILHWIACLSESLLLLLSVVGLKLKANGPVDVESRWACLCKPAVRASNMHSQQYYSLNRYEVFGLCLGLYYSMRIQVCKNRQQVMR